MTDYKDRPKGAPRKPSNAELAIMPRSLLSLFAAPSVGRLTNLFPRWLNAKIVSENGLTAPRMMLMWLLSRWNEPTMGQVAELLDLTPRAITRLVDGLEADGYVERCVHSEDRRVFKIKLTPEGRNKFKTLDSQMRPEFASLFSCLSSQELRTFIRTIEKLTDHMKDQLDH